MILGLCVVSCSKIGDRTPEKRFQGLEATATGIDFKNILTENDSLNYFTYGYIYMGGGVSAGDINNDGLIDLFFTGNQVSNRLYLNLGDLKFEDITDQAGIGGDSRWYTGATTALRKWPKPTVLPMMAIAFKVPFSITTATATLTFT
jgi:hypothetical protein